MASPISFFSVATQTVQNSPLLLFVMNLGLAAVTAIMLEKFYLSMGSSLSNKHRLAQTFLPITLTTTLIISVVKSSLALSLGLVGALSIVRFRTAIKEPEELAFLFITVALGLGFGAYQTELTLTAFLMLLGLLFLHRRWYRPANPTGLLVTIRTPQKSTEASHMIHMILAKQCTLLDLRRRDASANELQLVYHADFISAKHLDTAFAQLHQKFPHAQVSSIDQSSLLI